MEARNFSSIKKAVKLKPICQKTTNLVFLTHAVNQLDS